jgi:poly-gamma-glutamate synthesis protein (capsule biosynthesis protein)
LEPTATVVPTAPPEPIVKLAAVGDLMLARSIGRALQANPVDTPFAAVVEQLRGADITVGSLECALGNVGEPAPKAFTFRAPPEALPSLVEAGFDVLSLANNHTLDYGVPALDETLRLLQGAGIAGAGAGANAAAAHAPVFVERNGLRLAFLAYVNVPVERGGFVTESWTAIETTGMAWAETTRVAADVSAAKAQSDHVIVLLHSGYEGLQSPNDIQRANAYAVIDAGATLVVGHHPHVLQPVEPYGSGLIAYSLGNFVFNGFEGVDAQSAILNVTLTPVGIANYNFTSVVLRDGRPVLAEGNEATAILAQLE